MATVLIGEDETLIRLDIRANLEDAGYEVQGEARNGVEAVELARTLEPDVVILDVKMPQLDGIEAARQIIAHRPVPVVLLTAYSDEQLVQRAGEAGVFAYLVKPFRANELTPAIQTAITRHEELLGLRDEAETLADALAARKSIERAKGLLMKHEGLDEAEAFARLRTASQKSRQPLKAIADAIVAALD